LYPSREGEKLNDTEASVSVFPGTETRVRLPDALPPEDWTYVALQVRADGQAILVVNREPVLTNPIYVPTRPVHGWTLVIRGNAVDTNLFARNLNIWKGLRY
jgi:hypothetical protein